MTLAPSHTLIRLPDHPGALAGVLEAAVMAAAADGRPMALASLVIDFAADQPPGAALTLEGFVDRATRTLVFARAVARDQAGVVAASASAVVRVLSA